MKKTYKLNNLDCAHCAAKMENAIGRIEGVNSCSINFMTQKLVLDTEEGKAESVMPSVEKAIKKIDRRCCIA